VGEFSHPVRSLEARRHANGDNESPRSLEETKFVSNRVLHEKYSGMAGFCNQLEQNSDAKGKNSVK
jgi:hypothetical protein